MTNLPEDEERERVIEPADDTASADSSVTQNASDEPRANELPTAFAPDEFAPRESELPPPDPLFVSYAQPDAPPIAEPQLFQSFAQPVVHPPMRIPHFGHLSLVVLLLGVSSVCVGTGFFVASHLLHMNLEVTAQAAASNVPLLLGSEVAIYVVTFAFSFVLFPFFWHKKFFTGLQWRGAVVRKRFWWLVATALGCAGLAALDDVLMPGPANAPIDKMFSAPGAAWLLFAFGITVAPFFEEMAFRGFLLPALCTGFDWIAGLFSADRPDTLGANERPRWRVQAQLIAFLILLIPYAALSPRPAGHHLERVLLVGVWSTGIAIWWAIASAGTKSNAASTFALDANGHPQWSLRAMIAGSILTSIPFALLHVDQQGHSLGPFLLLIVVSLVLCAVRLKTRSLAASTLVHACYNFIIFSLALIGTSGFRHFDKM